LLPDVVSRLSAARRGPVTPVVQEEEAPSSPKKTLRFSVAPSPIQNEAAKKLRFSVAPSPPKKRVSILEEKDETLSAVDFQAIMGFLLAFVDKEKHAEALAEKLCQRLDATKADDDAFAKARGDDVQTASRRDLAFCLGKLMLTEKVTRKLAESIALYKDALPDEGVYAAFTAIVAKARKLPKDMKEVLDDWENKLLAGHERRLDLDGAGPAPVPQSAKKKKAPAKKRATRKKKVVQSDSDDEGGDALQENVPRARSTRPRRGVRA
jgi:condensin complex subunit 1